MTATPILAPPDVQPIPRLALRQNEAALALGVSVPTLREWTTAGVVPHVREGGVLLYPVDSLREWLASRAAERDE